MEKEYLISVIVTSYNPDLKKLVRTLSSIIVQADVNFELLISDDGSENDHFTEAADFLDSKNFDTYSLVKNKQNVGTVKNCYGAVSRAKGKYVYLTSPGDFLHDKYVLRDFTAFAEKEQAHIVFGDYIMYRNGRNGVELIEKLGRPYWPELFNSPVSFYQQVSFCFGNYIAGISYLRRTETFKRYLELIIPFSKYIEDNTTTAFALAENVRVYYYPRNITYYEYGEGVSTSKSSKWEKLLLQDFTRSTQKLVEMYPHNKAFAALLYSYIHEPSKIETILRFFRYPSVFCVQLINKFRKKHRMKYDNNEMQLLMQILNVEV